LAKIAVELEHALARRAKDGSPGALTARMLAQGDGWTVEDVVCTSGPRDRPYEERHVCYRIAVVVAGSFQCQTEFGRALMTPGSLLLGNFGQCFECGHEHGSGDRCVSFGYSPGLFEGLAQSAGVRSIDFRYFRLPLLGELASLVAHVCTGLVSPNLNAARWEELSIQLAGQALPRAAETSRPETAPPSSVARVSRVIRLIDRDPSAQLSLRDLAREARLSVYHFLRVFERLTGVTPHQYLRRARLRNAAVRLATGRERVLDIALDCGFGDVTRFNHAFRAEFGMSPRHYRSYASRAIRFDL